MKTETEEDQTVDLFLEALKRDEEEIFLEQLELLEAIRRYRESQWIFGN